MARSFEGPDLVPEGAFLAVLVLMVTGMYCNALDGDFVWDDRAAIVGNADIRSGSSIWSLFLHDFWGQDIRLRLSHKSYRPLTVLTFKMDHLLYGMNAYGFHATNLILYVLSCFTMYWFCKKWVSIGSARLAALLFAIHPVHVEAVSSLVGRADCLCGVFYFGALALYTQSARSEGHIASALVLLSAIVCGILASFAKEIGVTVFAVMVTIELVEALKPVIVQSPKFRVARHDKQSALTYGYLTEYSMRATAQFLLEALRGLLLSPARLLRVGACAMLVLLFFTFRAWLHGEHALYTWSVLENHIALLPTFQSRALSYAQTHFFYALKLFYPRHLCFDYGYACITVVDDIFDARNLLPAGLYALVAAVAYRALLRLRLPRLVGLAAMLLPLLPALNVFLAVGTLLAERLLFVPSMGFCLCMAEFLVEDSAWVWADANEKLGRWLQPAGGRGNPAQLEGTGVDPNGIPSTLRRVRVLRVALLPLALACALRVTSRNRDWGSELALYSSALSVCPRSLKTLANYAVLANGAGMQLAARDAGLAGLALFPRYTAGAVNAALADVELGQFAHSVALLEYAAHMDPSAQKIPGYLSKALLGWASSRSAHAEIALGLRRESSRWIGAALERGGATPAMLYHAGSVALEEGNPREAMDHYLAAINLSLSLSRQFREHSRHVPVDDDIRLAFAYNQLASAAMAAGLRDEAVRYYEAGLQLEPDSEALLTNLSSLYRERGLLGRAQAMLEGALQRLGPRASAALANNYGNVLLDLRRYAEAAEYFQMALDALRRHGERDERYVFSASGTSAEAMAERNLAIARSHL